MNPLTASQQIESIRGQLVQARGAIYDLQHTHGWKERTQDVAGLLTCGLVALHSIKQDMIEVEIRQDDEERGPSLPFSPRGLGFDCCPGCFACNGATSHFMTNLAAFVSSMKDGERIVSWFNGRARLDYRPQEPNWIQVKIGCCDQHKPNLQRLYAATLVYGRIRERDVVDAKAEPIAVNP